MEFTSVERAAIESILAEPVDGIDILREQFAHASVVSRKYTGVGFYTRLSVPQSLPAMRKSPELLRVLFHAGAARVRSDPEELIIFHLWTSDEGCLSTLEGVTSKRDYWPDECDIEVIRR
jgi:hypothetical protein